MEYQYDHMCDGLKVEINGKFHGVQDIGIKSQP